MFRDNAWLAGFADGEGCFALQRSQRAGWVQPTFRIGLRADDSTILAELKEEFGGSLTVRHHRGRRNDCPVADWVVGSKDDLRKIVAYFDRYPLRAKKAGDYAIWREAVLIYLAGNRRSPELPGCFDRLQEVRKYAGVAA